VSLVPWSGRSPTCARSTCTPISVAALGLVGWTLVVVRCHDFNRTVWLTFWTDQVPVIGPFWALYELVAKPGSVGMNSYGMPPRF
jgi:uncharacterized membrane protein YhaH (DUF805 family)